MKLTLSPLLHTWILDLDGTIVVHNGYKIYGHDLFLDGAEAFLKTIPEDDTIIFLTSRTEEYKDITEQFLANNHIKFQQIIYNAPFGERIIVNDRKPSGLDMAYGINVERDSTEFIEIVIDKNL